MNGTRQFVAFATALLACCGRPDEGSRSVGAATPPTPTATTATATPATTAPSSVPLAVRFPHAGDTLVEGRSYVIRWSAPAGMRVSLGLVMGGKDRGMLVVAAPAKPDSLVWQVPVGFVTGFGITSSDQVRLRLEDADSAARYVDAGPFTVTAGSERLPGQPAPAR